MSLLSDESELVALVDMALKDAYPGRSLSVGAEPRIVGWIEVIVTETGPAGARRIAMPVKRKRITFHRLKDVRDELIGDLMMQLGRPGRVA